jgi:hypothetical protein
MSCRGIPSTTLEVGFTTSGACETLALENKGFSTPIYAPSTLPTFAMQGEEARESHLSYTIPTGTFFLSIENGKVLTLDTFFISDDARNHKLIL